MVWDDDGAGGIRTMGFPERRGKLNGIRRRRGGRDCVCEGGSTTSGDTTPRGGRVAVVGGTGKRGMGLVVRDDGAGRIRLKGSIEGRGNRAGDGLRRRGDCDCDGGSTTRPGRVVVGGRGRGLVITVKKGSVEGGGNRAGDGLRRRGGGGVAFL